MINLIICVMVKKNKKSSAERHKRALLNYSYIAITSSQLIFISKLDSKVSVAIKDYFPYLRYALKQHIKNNMLQYTSDMFWHEMLLFNSKRF